MDFEGDPMAELNQTMVAGFRHQEMLLKSGDTDSSKLDRSEEHEDLAVTVEPTLSDVLVVWGQEVSADYDEMEATERRKGITHLCADCGSSACRAGYVACVLDVDTMMCQWTAMFSELPDTMQAKAKRKLQMFWTKTGCSPFTPNSIGVLGSHLSTHWAVLSPSDPSRSTLEVFLERLTALWKLMENNRRLWITRFYVHDLLSSKRTQPGNCRRLQRLQATWVGFSITSTVCPQSDVL